LFVSFTPLLFSFIRESGLIGLLDLREHALFALRNLLERNKENQAIVEEMKPMAEWDDNGVLRNVDGRTRK
jgi:hypothetical protein